MKYDMILFDLDGTLLPMDQERFVKGYLGYMTKRMATAGYEPEKLVSAIWHGTFAMMNNNGRCTNEELFWRDMEQFYGPDVRKDIPLFDEFYATDFQKARALCGFAPESREVIDLIHSLGGHTALATNPLFPAAATHSRIRWAGLTPEDFELITTYENISRCKPDPVYYREITARLGVEPEKCLMVGNDADEDAAAAETGMDVFLLTPCLINRHEKDISALPHGGFGELKEYLRQALS